MSAAKLGICFLHIVLEPTCFRAALNILFELSQNTHTITHISEVLRCASFDTMNFECYEGFSHILNDYAADVGGRGWNLRQLVEHPTRALGTGENDPSPWHWHWSWSSPVGHDFFSTGMLGIVTFSLKLWLLREIVVLNHLLTVDGLWVAIFPMAESSSFPATWFGHFFYSRCEQ
jgi:hypothetical protein